jgi:5'(3')-deoxyribonucleotidase
MAVIALDVDDTVLDLVTTWLSLYNTEFEDTLTKDQILDWDIASFVKSDAKDMILSYIKDSDVFYGSQPIEDALEAVQYMKSLGHRIIFVTVNNVDNCKINWLKEKGFLERDEDFVCCKDKSLIRADCLIDDNYDNCMSFKTSAFLFSQPWNLKYDYPFRITDWRMMIDSIKSLGLEPKEC